MNIEIREDAVLISGYVNAVERTSKPIKEYIHGKVRTFLEKIRAGAFKQALEDNDDVLVLLNHDNDRLLARTSNGSALLEEDNIGLRAEIIITDPDVIDKARNGRLVGWSFGFRVNESDDELGEFNGDEIRTINRLDLVEVSILDDSCSPAYYGTSIESRDENSTNLEIRSETFDVKVTPTIEERVIKLEEELSNLLRTLKEEDIDYSEYERRINSIRR